MGESVMKPFHSIKLLYVLAALMTISCFALSGCDSDESGPGSGVPAQPDKEPDQKRKGDTSMTFTITSSAFGAGAVVPVRHTGDGVDVSPALTFANAPEGTKELALICDDPDAPTPQPWVHWVIYKIPAGTEQLPENVKTSAGLTQPAGALQGVNSWGAIGYRGPAPPQGHGVHHYHFKLYALDTPLSVKSGMDKQALLTAMKEHILAETELIGTYQR